MVRAAFGHRRKTLLNSLHYDLGERIAKEDIATALSRASIDDKRRGGETLNIEEFALLTTALTELLR